ncbi:MAG: carboxypeptidase regulatory-like domain-containing protein, partial [Planctomycetota bacterium]
KPVLEASEAGGKFSLGGFFPGSWTLQVQGEGSAGRNELSRSLAVVLPGDRLRGRFVLPRRAKLSGRVVDGAGGGVPGAQVTLRQQGPRSSVREHSLRSDEQGGFTFDPAPWGVVALYAEQADLGRSATSELRLEPGEDRQGGSLVLAVEGDPRRLGRVIGQLAPELGDIASQFIWMSREGDSAVRTARAGRDGSFSFEGVAAGRYLLSSAAGKRMERFSQAKPGEEFSVLPQRTVDLSPGEEVHVVLGASSALNHVVSGRVTENGRPLGGVMLEFQTERDGRAYRVQVDELGAFSLATVSPGTASVLLMDPVLRTTAQLQAQIAETPRSDLHLELASSRMSLLVRGPDLQPAAGMSVRVFNEGSSLEVLREGRTDDQGRTSLLGLEPGNYRLYAGHRAAPQAQLWAVAHGTPSSTLQSISWSGRSDSQEFEVQLEAGAELSLQVERTNGLSVDGVEVSLRYEPALDPALQLSAQGAGSTGRLFYYGLPAGKARLLARDGGREQFSELIDLRPGEQSRLHFVLNL